MEMKASILSALTEHAPFDFFHDTHNKKEDANTKNNKWDEILIEDISEWSDFTWDAL